MAGRETCEFLQYWDDCPLTCSSCPGGDEYLIGCCLTGKKNLTFCPVYCEDHPKCVNHDSAEGDHIFIASVLLLFVVVVLFICYAEKKRIAKERNLSENWLAKKRVNDGMMNAARLFLNK